MSTFEKKIDQYISQGVFDGAVILAGTENEDLFSHTQGLSNRNTGRPMSMDTVFDVSSVSKPVGTATAILLLAERGLLDIEKPFTEYLPEYSGTMVNPNVNLRMLASHYSGIIPDYPLGVSAEELMTRMLKSPFVHEPNTLFRYCCVNYDFMSLIVERISGQPLEVFAEENIFRPLGMTDTAWATPKPEQRDRLVIHCRCVDSDPAVIFDRWAQILHPHAMGNAGIFTTAPDLAKYARMILRKGKGLFKTDIVEREMFPNFAPEGMRPRSFGWDLTPELLIPNFSAQTIYHSGSSGQSMWIDWGKGKFCIVLTNLFGEHDAGIAARLDVATEITGEIWK